MRPLTVVVSCEHAEWGVPAALSGLGLSETILRSHVSWDPGARIVAEQLSGSLEVPLHAGRWSRLLVDLNRDPEGPEAVPTVAFGVTVPGNQELGQKAIRRRLAEYHAPYWAAVHRNLRGHLDKGRVWHLSVHTFDPSYPGPQGEAERPWDFGILYDPRAPFEAEVAAALEPRLVKAGYRVGRNVPYDGRSDFLVTSMRRRFAADRYAGILLEVSQRNLQRLNRLASDLAETVDTVRAFLGAPAQVFGGSGHE